MKIFALLLLFFTAGKVSYGQTAFNYVNDFKKVLSQTKDRDDGLYYEKLLKRFDVNDTTLTDFEILALLIGFTDKPEYKPYHDLETERKIYALNDEGKFKEALDSADIFLKTHPFSVKVLFEKAYASSKLGENDSAIFYSYKGRRIFGAMFFSGDGKTMETPTFALGPADGQDYIYKFVGSSIGGADIGFMGSGSDKSGNFLDILGVVPEDGTASYNLYFIIQHTTDKMFSAEDKLKMDGVLKEMEKDDKKDKKKRKIIKPVISLSIIFLKK